MHNKKLNKMEALDKFINKVGNDKVLHFLVGAWITALLSPIGWGAVVVGFVLVLFLSVIKEVFLDDAMDPWDIVAGVAGSVASIIIF